MKRQILIGLSLISLAAAPAWAATSWATSVNRGLETYQIKNDAAEVQLTCDPDRVFGGSSNASLHVDFGQSDKATTLVVLSKSGHQAPLTIDQDGFAFQAQQDPKAWADMVGFIKSGGDYAFVTSANAAQFDKVAPIGDLRCS